MDKSVNVNSNTFYDIAGNPILTIDSEPTEFLVTLSALSQSYSIETVVEPTDTVFVLDVSGSMDQNRLGTGPDAPTRAEVMVEALNDAIRTIMEASPENRVAVVAYGGYQLNGWRTMSPLVLELGHYDIAGDYFTIDGNVISATPALLATGSVTTEDVTVQGGTPTQRGIYRGAQVLTGNTDTQYTYTSDEGDEITLTRRPSIVLLTDGDPTYAWHDYQIGAAHDVDTVWQHGNGSASDMGMDLLTVLTAAYWKGQVTEHYYGDEDKQAHFYTIGVGVSGVHAPSVLDPVNNAQNNSQTYDPPGAAPPATYNMKTLLDQFVSSGQITFPVLNQNSGSARTLVTLTNTAYPVENWAYTDGYYAANDTQGLQDAFDSIAYDIISKGNYTTGADPERPDFSGYVVLSDTIGEHMRFGEYDGVLFGGELHDGRQFAQAVTADYADDGVLNGEAAIAFADALAERLTSSASGNPVSRDDILDMIRTSIEGGLLYYNSEQDYNSAIRAYADFNVDYLGPYYDDVGNVADPPAGAACFVEWYPVNDQVVDGVTGDYTNLLHMYLSVTTALVTGDFGLRGEDGTPIPEMDIHLFEEQQLVRWYIPASLIPMRTVSEAYDPDNPDVVTGLEIKQALPARANYTVKLRPDFDVSLLSDEYKAQNSTPDGDGYYFYSNDWRYGGGESDDTSVAVFEPNPYNPFYYATEDKPLWVREGDGYRPAESSDPDGTEFYVREDYFDSTVEGYLVEQYILVDQTITNIARDGDGVPYVPEGELRKSTAAIILKTENPTGTYDFRVSAAFSAATEFFLLGNNGRLEVGLTDVSVRKVWAGEPLESVWVQLYADGEPYRDPVLLEAGNSWEHTWDELLEYRLEMDDAGEVDPVEYTVAEGTYEEGVFTPYSTANPLNGYNVYYQQPVRDEGTGTWSEAVVTNSQLPDATLKASKAISGLSETAEVFSFTLTQVDETGEPVPEGITRTAQTTGTIGSAGQEVSFPVIGGLQEGTYYFEITEEAGGASNWTYSTESYTVTVVAEGEVATITYPEPYSDENPPVFTNTYTLPPSVVIRAEKEIAGTIQTAEIFSFTLTQVDSGGEPVPGGITRTAQTTGSIGSAGQVVSFPEITDLSEGTYYFETTEEVGSASGWTYSTESHTVTVTVDGGEATVTYPESYNDENPPVFTNTYTPPPGTAILRLSKAISGLTEADEVFSFTLTQVDETGEPVPEGITLTAQTTGTIGSAGQMVSFPQITMGQGVYYFSITEDTGSAPGWTYSTEDYTAVVTVEVVDGQATITYPEPYSDENPPVFTNAYAPPPGAVIQARKAISGLPETDQVFTFTLTQVDSEGDTIPGGITDTVQTAGTITSTGQTVSFAELSDLGEGTYYFEITEEAGSASGWTYSAEGYTVTVTVDAAGESIVIYPEPYGTESPPLFTNVYSPPPVTSTTTTTSTTTPPPTSTSTTTTSGSTSTTSTIVSVSTTTPPSTAAGGDFDPPTGDDSNPALWITLCALSAVGLAIIGTAAIRGYRRRSRI